LHRCMHYVTPLHDHVTLSLIFFFSSRRRHTRSLCDWSSDVCSSDLKTLHLFCLQSCLSLPRCIRACRLSCTSKGTLLSSQLSRRRASTSPSSSGMNTRPTRKRSGSSISYGLPQPTSTRRTSSHCLLRCSVQAASPAAGPSNVSRPRTFPTALPPTAPA